MASIRLRTVLLGGALVGVASLLVASKLVAGSFGQGSPLVQDLGHDVKSVLGSDEAIGMASYDAAMPMPMATAAAKMRAMPAPAAKGGTPYTGGQIANVQRTNLVLPSSDRKIVYNAQVDVTAEDPIKAEGALPTNSRPMIKACANPSGEGCTAYDRLMPH